MIIRQHHYRPLTRTLRREDREGRRLVFDVSRGDPGDTLCEIVFNICFFFIFIATLSGTQEHSFVKE